MRRNIKCEEISNAKKRGPVMRAPGACLPGGNLSRSNNFYIFCKTA
ncbi:hypothetical protein BRYFOR_06007 [Marvinbryantia formatexigens DSM 14469]|uniref:Uncharacterized protein n=1 Tax=Marvinbryantia formatexigens DSM 14469 TaxID=478749 RepID=C6LBL2_9FIRM|nr:hypothetical protein BRYFOR_06007 [Marvinbryantia formatexigens DSM 14469]